MSQLWDLLLYQPLLNFLIGLYKLTGNLGWSIVLLTIGLRLAMTPLVIPSLKITKKVQELAPEIAKLKEKYQNDKQGFITAQAELYKQHGANPASGCLPQVVQLLVLIALFSVFNAILKIDGGSAADRLTPSLYSSTPTPADLELSPRFFYLDLTRPDTFKLPGVPFGLPGLFLLLSALTQLLSSKMLAPVVTAEKKVAAKTSGSTDDAMVEVQQQMMYMFPLMTLLIGYSFPSGLVLYWFVFSAVSMLQQYFITGWGGLEPWVKRYGLR